MGYAIRALVAIAAAALAVAPSCHAFMPAGALLSGVSSPRASGLSSVKLRTASGPLSATRMQSTAQETNQDTLVASILYSIKDTDLRSLFQQFDIDGSGSINDADWESALRSFGLSIPKQDQKALLTALDSNKDGVVDFKDFQISLDRLREQPAGRATLTSPTRSDMEQWLQSSAVSSAKAGGLDAVLASLVRRKVELAKEAEARSPASPLLSLFGFGKKDDKPQAEAKKSGVTGVTVAQAEKLAEKSAQSTLTKKREAAAAAAAAKAAPAPAAATAATVRAPQTADEAKKNQDNDAMVKALVDTMYTVGEIQVGLLSQGASLALKVGGGFIDGVIKGSK